MQIDICHGALHLNFIWLIITSKLCSILSKTEMPKLQTFMYYANAFVRTWTTKHRINFNAILIYKIYLAQWPKPMEMHHDILRRQCAYIWVVFTSLPFILQHPWVNCPEKWVSYVRVFSRHGWSFNYRPTTSDKKDYQYFY